MRVARTEVTRLDAIVELPNGGIRVDAFPTRIGVLEYADASGKTWREYRPADEVFKADSLATLRAATVTDLHPEKPVDPSNWNALAKGHVGDDVRRADDLVAGSLVINDAAAVAAVKAGDRVELSCGYECDVDPTPGETPEGERYDAVQRNIRYNHVALGPSDWGRAGPRCAMRLDGGAGVHVRPAGVPARAPKTTTTTVRADASAGERKAMARKLKIGGREVRVDADEDMPGAQAAVDEQKKKDDDAASALQAQCDATQAALQDAMTSNAQLNAQLKAQLAAAQATAATPAPVTEESVPPEVLDAALAKRAAVVDVALAHGIKADALKGKGTLDVHRAVIAKVFPSVKTDGLDAKALAPLFAAAQDAAKSPPRNDALARANEAAHGADATGAPARADAAEADPADVMEKNREAQRAEARRRAR